MGQTRQLQGPDLRGSSYDRRARRAWLLSPSAGFGGDGTKVPCWECGALVDDDTMIVDRIIPGELGGTYRRDNIRPHCRTCSCRQGARRTLELWQARRAADPYGPDDLCRTCGAHYLGVHADGCPTPELDGTHQQRPWSLHAASRYPQSTRVDAKLALRCTEAGRAATEP